MLIQITLPPAFVRDCIECDCDVGQWDGKRLSCTPEQLAELTDRAKHYAFDGLDDAPRGLVLSARATLKRLAARAA
jgi:hypothetical protein